jgi:hypothetical protein
MATALPRDSMLSRALFIVLLRACSFEDSIFDRILASRLLGRNTFAMAEHLYFLTNVFTAFMCFNAGMPPVGDLQANDLVNSGS